MSKFSENEGAIFYDEGKTIDVASLGLHVLSALVASKMDTAREQGFRVMKGELFVGSDNFAAGENVVLYAIGPSLDNTKATEAIESDPQLGDAVSREAPMRPVWPLCVIGDDNKQPNNGMPIVWKPRWSFPEGTGLQFGCYNFGDTALSAASQTVFVHGKYYGVWLKD